MTDFVRECCCGESGSGAEEVGVIGLSIPQGRMDGGKGSTMEGYLRNEGNPNCSPPVGNWLRCDWINSVRPTNWDEIWP